MLTIDQSVRYMAKTLLARPGADRLTIEQRVRCVRRKKTLLARFGDDLGDPRPASPKMQS